MTKFSEFKDGCFGEIPLQIGVFPFGLAFGILGITVGLKWDKIQKKFKKLVKKFHPDINAGDKKFEEKLKVITLAYTQLKNTYRKRK